MESSVDKMVLSGGVGAEIDARNSLQHGRGSFSPAATESGLSPDHRGDPSSMGEAANDAPSAAATSGPSPKLHSGHPPSITVPAARTVGMSPEETVDERPTAHDTTTSVTTPATSPARQKDDFARRCELLRMSIKLQQTQLELMMLEEAGSVSSLGKAEEWLCATDRCGTGYSGKNGAEIFASTTENPLPTNSAERSHEFLAWRRAMEAGLSAPAMEATKLGNTMADRRDAGRDHFSLRNTRVENHTATADHLNTPRQTLNTHAQKTFGVNWLSQSQISARQVTPRELPTFSGLIEEWPIFLANYQHSTEICGYSDEENLLRLQRALKGAARETVGHLLLLPAGLEEAMATLKARYGRPELMVESMIEGVRRMPNPRADKLDSLVDFGFAVRRLCATVRVSGMEEYLYNVTLLRELTNKLPPSTCVEWARHQAQVKLYSGRATLEHFGKWIGKLAEDISAVAPCALHTELNRPQDRRNASDQSRAPQYFAYQPDQQRGTQHPYHRPNQRNSNPPPPGPPHTTRLNIHNTTADSTSATNSCMLCGGTCEALVVCSRFLGASVAARRAFVNERRLCKLCVGYHRSKCGVAESCGVNGCQTKHHKLLHDPEALVPHVPETTRLNTHSGSPGKVLLKYVPVVVHGPRGRLATYALLDDGSTATFMEHGLLEELGLSGTPDPLQIQWTGHVTREEKNSVRLSLRISGVNAKSTVHELADVRTLSELALPSQSISAPRLSARYTYLAGLPIESYEYAVPRILIGVDNYGLAQPLRSIQGGSDQPAAMETPLGWVVCGPCAEIASTSGPTHLSIHVCTCEQLTTAVREFYALDAVGIEKPGNPLRSKDDERAIEMLERETTLIGDRYETGLLWRYDDVRLPCNKAQALKRYACLQAKMRKDPVLAEAVNTKMNDYLDKGYIRRVSAEELTVRQDRDWYLPVFPVTNPNKPGKVRMVFDAAAKVNGVSLNTFLMTGPDLLAGLLSVLIKFREFKVGVVGDICEMFHRVMMKPKDQRSQMIFWRGDDPDSEPAAYAMTVMTFGAACSPSCAQFVKNRNADRFADKFPRAAECIKTEHYVDDMLVSMETEEECVKLAQEVREIHARGGFHIRNWVSNSRTVVELLRDTQNEKSINLGSDLETEKVLGMWWDTALDCFTFKLSPRHDAELLSGRKPATKREVLRTQMSVYDPMGFLGQFLMFLKVLLQEIWRAGSDWDEGLQGQLVEKWMSWIKLLPDVSKVMVPRCFRHATSTNAYTELHVFCDASEVGMAAVAYLRFEEDGVVECALIGSKTKVAPLQFLSIPRLELTAAVIGARLADFILSTLRLQIARSIFWSDSRNVLSWLHSDHRRYNQYVACRVGQLLEKTDVAQWRWIPTKDNVADDGTKWAKLPDLSPASRWFRGPSFLWGPESEWPEQDIPEKNTTEELRKNIQHHRIVEPLVRYERFSKWNRLLRAMAYVVRFTLNTRRNSTRETGPLTQHELAEGERVLLTQIQRDGYPTEIRVLKSSAKRKHTWGQLIEKNSPLYKQTPVLDNRGILRVGGRLSACASVEDSVRQPIILPRDHWGTSLLIRDFHERYKHCNHGTVINEIRSKFYIPRLHGEYKRVRKMCQRCSNESAVPVPPLMGNIPSVRTAIGQRAFSFTGIDYFGPILVAVGRRVEKRWGVIFTCMTARAIHLEVAHSLTTASCIMAIRRFITKRGTPLEMISDRGTNFVGASRELQDALEEVDQDVLMTEFSGPSMKWSFNPPGAPHFGGCWERLVQSVKKVLSKYSLPRRPTDEVLQTTLAEVEFIINSRPLTYVSLDHEMDTPITPNHLLLGSSDGRKPPVAFADDGAALKSAWKAVQHNADFFWRKWVAEYLPTLTQRAKWCEKTKPIAEGDIVVICDGNLPRNSWPKGRVIAVARAKDGQVRQATVHTASGIYIRPATKIAILEVN